MNDKNSNILEIDFGSFDEAEQTEKTEEMPIDNRMYQASDDENMPAFEINLSSVINNKVSKNTQLDRELKNNSFKGRDVLLERDINHHNDINNKLDELDKLNFSDLLVKEDNANKSIDLLDLNIFSNNKQELSSSKINKLPAVPKLDQSLLKSKIGILEPSLTQKFNEIPKTNNLPIPQFANDNHNMSFSKLNNNIKTEMPDNSSKSSISLLKTEEKTVTKKITERPKNKEKPLNLSNTPKQTKVIKNKEKTKKVITAIFVGIIISSVLIYVTIVLILPIFFPEILEDIENNDIITNNDVTTNMPNSDINITKPKILSAKQMDNSEIIKKDKIEQNDEKLKIEELNNTENMKLSYKGNNQVYFENIHNAILSGDPQLVIKNFNMPLLTELVQEEQIYAEELKMRFFLLIGQKSKALNPLENHCQTISEENVFQCVHFVRALIINNQYSKVNNKLKQINLILKKLENGENKKNLEAIYKLLIASNKALSTPNYNNMLELFNHYLSPFVINGEWYKERSIFIVKTLVKLSRIDKQKFLNHILVDKKDDFLNSYKLASKMFLTSSDSILIPVLGFFSTCYGINFPDLSLPRFNYQLDINNIGKTIAIISSYLMGSENRAKAILLQIDDIPEYLELIDLAKYNYDANLQNWKDIARILATKKISTIWNYEWELLNARYALFTQNIGIIYKAYESLEKIIKTSNNYQLDYYYWLLKSRLLLFLKKDTFPIIAKTKQLAVSNHEKAMIIVEEAKLEKEKNNINKAIDIIEHGAKKYNNDGFLLLNAAEIVGQVGINAVRYIDNQNNLSEKYFSTNFNFQIISELSIIEIINKI